MRFPSFAAHRLTNHSNNLLLRCACSRRHASTVPSFNELLQLAATPTRTHVSYGVDSINNIATIARNDLGAMPGTRCLVLATSTSAKRAAIVPHFLRKGGVMPLLCELPEAAPISQNVAAAVDMAKRTGSTMVAAYGGSAVISVGRVAASIIANGGRVRDYASGQDGSAKPPANPSLPFLAVPSCPSGMELTREAVVLGDGNTLSTLKAHPGSVQAAVIDPRLAVSLEGEQCLNSGYATLVHAIEAYMRTDSDPMVRRLSWFAVQLASRCLGATLSSPKDVAARADMAVASALVSAAMATGCLGPCRGIGLTIASRYQISYSAAVTAVGPEVLSCLSEFFVSRWEDEKEQSDAAGGDGSGQGEPMTWRDNLDEDEDAIMRRRKTFSKGGGRKNSMFTSPASGSKGDRKPVKQSTSGSDAVEQEDAGGSEFDRQLREFAETASANLEVADAEEDSDTGMTVQRLRHVAYAIKQALASPQGPLLDLSNVRDMPATHLGDPGQLGSLLVRLRDCGKGVPGGVNPPSLDDYALSDADIGSIADAAEVDENTLSCLVQLRNSDIKEILKRC